MSRKLDYRSAAPASPPSSIGERLKVALLGGGIGFVALLAFGGIAKMGGPVFPASVVFAPVWLAIELTDESRISGEALLFLGGPTLFAGYALLLTVERRRSILPWVLGAHIVSAVFVTWMRDQLF